MQIPKIEKDVTDYDLDTDDNEEKENIVKTSFSLVEVSGDLFSSPPSHSLCHCVSRDFRLGKGVAKIFRDKFGRIDELKQSGAGVTDIAVLKEGNRFIYNLVTKEVYSGKPTYDHLRQCLEKMRDHGLEHSVTQISMPRIGCGLDMLTWSAVKTLIKNVFLNTNITITVYTLEDKPEKPKTTIADMFKKGEKSKKENIKDTKKRTELGFGYSTTNPLPDVFNNKKVHIRDDVEDAEKFQQYITAYGGDLAEESNIEEATHVVYKNKSDKAVNKCDNNAKHVSYKWLEDSIKLKTIQDERLYRVKKQSQ